MDPFRRTRRSRLGIFKGRIVTLFLALLLDAAMGEPRWLWAHIPHPAVMIGRIITWATDRLNHGPARRMKGVFLVFALVAGAAIIGAAIAQLGWMAEVIFAAILLAQRSLCDHVADVARGLRMSVAQGRRSVAMIVGRDTTHMTAPDISRAAIESAAENFSDGVLAPAFWFAVLGLPGILIYKAVNTADSMIGYKTPEFAEFGWASARLDDALNWAPARLTAVLITITFGLFDGWRDATKDAALHRSPNAGWSEAFLSRALGIAVSGPRWYHGELKQYAWVNAMGRRDANAKDIDGAVTALWKIWAVLLTITIPFALFDWLPLLG